MTPGVSSSSLTTAEQTLVRVLVSALLKDLKREAPGGENAERLVEHEDASHERHPERNTQTDGR